MTEIRRPSTPLQTYVQAIQRVAQARERHDEAMARRDADGVSQAIQDWQNALTALDVARRNARRAVGLPGQGDNDGS